MIGSAILKKLADEILLLAVEQCPVDTQSLAKSGKVRVLNRGIVMVSFGEGIVEGESRFAGRKIGGPIDYATVVHEDETLFHPYGKAKFLEDAALYVLGFSQSNGLNIHMKIELGLTLNGSENCIAVFLYNPDIVDDSMVSGEPLGGGLGIDNNIEEGRKESLWERIKITIRGIWDSIKAIVEGFRK